MRSESRDAYQSWLVGELLLIGSLGAGLALFVSKSSLLGAWNLLQLRLVLDTAVAVAAALVAVLAGIRPAGVGGGSTCSAPDSRRSSRDGGVRDRSRARRGAAAPCRGLGRARGAAGGRGADRRGGLVRGRITERGLALRGAIGGCGVLLRSRPGRRRGASAAGAARARARGLERAPFALTGVIAAQAMLALVAGIGFGWRFRAHREDFDRWLALAATPALFAQLHYVSTPLRPAAQVSLGDFLRLLSYGLLLVGVERHRPRRAWAGRRGGAPASRARSTTGWRSTSSPCPRTRACWRTARTRRPRCRGCARPPRWPSRRRASPCLRCPRRAATRRSTSKALRGLPHRGRRARRRARVRRERAARAGRADRGLPHRPGRARQRTPPCGSPARRRGDRAQGGPADRLRTRRRLGLRRGEGQARSGPAQHPRPRGNDRRRVQPALASRRRHRAGGPYSARNLPGWSRSEATPHRHARDRRSELPAHGRTAGRAHRGGAMGACSNRPSETLAVADAAPPLARVVRDEAVVYVGGRSSPPRSSPPPTSPTWSSPDRLSSVDRLRQRGRRGDARRGLGARRAGVRLLFGMERRAARVGAAGGGVVPGGRPARGTPSPIPTGCGATCCAARAASTR